MMSKVNVRVNLAADVSKATGAIRRAAVGTARQAGWAAWYQHKPRTAYPEQMTDELVAAWQSGWDDAHLTHYRKTHTP